MQRQTQITSHTCQQDSGSQPSERLHHSRILIGLLGLTLACLLGLGLPAVAEDEAGAGENPFAGDQTAIMLGKVTFEAQCATQCHPKEADWKGGKYPDLFDCESLHGGSDAEMFKTATDGVPKTEMLGWKGKLSDDVLWKVIAYLKSASQCQESSNDSSHHLFEESQSVFAEAAH